MNMASVAGLKYSRVRKTEQTTGISPPADSMTLSHDRPLALALGPMAHLQRMMEQMNLSVGC
jgi:hypothetical protein